MKSKIFYFVIFGMCLLMLLAPRVVKAQDDLVVMSWGGTWGDSIKNNVIKPFEKEFGVKVKFVKQLNTRDGLNKLIAQKDNPQVDVWTGGKASQAIAVEHGLLREISEELIPNIKYQLQKGTKYSVNWYTMSPGIFYRSDKTPFEIKTWEDLWDKRLKGKIAVPEAPYCDGQWLVVASLLAGGNEYNMKPGFAKLEELKPNIAMFFKTDTESIKLLEAGEGSVAAMGLIPNVYKLLGQGSKYRFIVPEKPLVIINDNVAAVKRDNGNFKLACKFINYMLSIKPQEDHCRTLGLVPINKNAKRPPNIEGVMPKTYENLYEIDLDTVNKHLREWTEVYNKRIKSQ